MKIHLIAVLLFVGLAKAFLDNNDWPSYIKKCSASDPDFKKCLLINANIALKAVFRGDPVIGIPDFINYPVEEIMLGKNESYKFRLHDGVGRGLSHLLVKDIDWDLEKKIIQITFLHEAAISIQGKYESSGMFHGKDIKGKGEVSWIFTGGNQSGYRGYHMEYDTIMIGGAEFVQIKKTSCSNKESLRIDITNELISEEQAAADVEYWNAPNRKVDKDFFSLINKLGCAGVSAAFNAIFYNFPLHVIIEK